MGKKLVYIISLGVLFCLWDVSPVRAIDYTRLSTLELFELRGAVSNAPEAEQKAYAAELKTRIDAMSEEERKQYADLLKTSDNSELKGSDIEVQPQTPGKGYEEQGRGGVLFGGGDLPPDVQLEGLKVQ